MAEAYLDHAASTPMRPEAIAAALDVWTRTPGNPSGQHRWARAARRLLDDARDRVAEVAGGAPAEVVFTSGGTEADNLAITGAVAAAPPGGTAACLGSDHHAAIEPVHAAGGVLVAVGRDGVVDLDRLAALVAHGVDGRPLAVVSLALANNEVGTIQPVAEVVDVVHRAARSARRSRPLVHVDAVAAAAWVPLAEAVAGADLVSLSGHKVGGPKGIGALVVRDGAAVAPLLLGGPQEREQRAGTPDVAGAVGFAVALTSAHDTRAETAARVGGLRDRLADGLRAAVPGLAGTSPAGTATLPNLLHVGIPGVEREPLLFLLDQAGVAASSGSSCASGALEPSHVLLAMDVAPELAAGALRLSLGWCTTGEEVDHALAVIPEVVARLRAGAGLGVGERAS